MYNIKIDIIVLENYICQYAIIKNVHTLFIFHIFIEPHTKYVYTISHYNIIRHPYM